MFRQSTRQDREGAQVVFVAVIALLGLLAGGVIGQAMCRSNGHCDTTALTDCRAELARCLAENERVRVLLEDCMNGLCPDLVDITNVNITLTGDVAALQSLLDDCQIARDGCFTARDDLEQKLAQCTASKAAAEGEIARLTVALTECTETKADLEDAIEECKAGLDASELEAKLAECRSEKTAMATELAAAEAKSDLCAAALLASDAAASECATAQAATEGLLQACNLAKAEALGQAAAYQEVSEVCLTSKAVLQTQIDECSADLATLTGSLAACNDARSSAENLLEICQNAGSGNAALEEELRLCNESKAVLAGQVGQLTAQLATLNDTLEACNAARSSTEALLATTTEQLTACNAARSSTEALLEDCQNACSGNAALEEALLLCNGDKAALTAQVSTLTGSVDAYADQVSVLNDDVIDLQGQLTGCAADLNTCTASSGTSTAEFYANWELWYAVTNLFQPGNTTTWYTVMHPVSVVSLRVRVAEVATGGSAVGDVVFLRMRVYHYNNGSQDIAIPLSRSTHRIGSNGALPASNGTMDVDVTVPLNSIIAAGVSDYLGVTFMSATSASSTDVGIVRNIHATLTMQ